VEPLGDLGVLVLLLLLLMLMDEQKDIRVVEAGKTVNKGCCCRTQKGRRGD